MIPKDYEVISDEAYQFVIQRYSFHKEILKWLLSGRIPLASGLLYHFLSLMNVLANMFIYISCINFYKAISSKGFCWFFFLIIAFYEFYKYHIKVTHFNDIVLQIRERYLYYNLIFNIHIYFVCLALMKKNTHFSN